jgi:hypothetical protein
MSRLFLSRNIEDGNGRAGHSAWAASVAPVGKRDWATLRVRGEIMGWIMRRPD